VKVFAGRAQNRALFAKLTSFAKNPKSDKHKWLPHEDRIRPPGRRREPDQQFQIHRIYIPPGGANLRLRVSLLSYVAAMKGTWAIWHVTCSIYGCKLWRRSCFWTIFAMLCLRWMLGL